MTQTIQYLQEQISNPNNWLIIIGLLLSLSELILGIQAGLDLLLIGSILVVGGFTGLAFNSFWISIGTSIFLSVIYLTYARQFVKSKIIVSTQDTNIDKLVGKTAVVTKQISPHEAGMVKIDDEQWRAKSDENLSLKTKVKIIAVSGVSLKVQKV